MFNIFKKTVKETKNDRESYSSEDIDKIIDSHNNLYRKHLKQEKELKLTQKRMEEIELKRAEELRELKDLIKKSNLLNLEDKKEDKKSSEKDSNSKKLDELINRKIGA